MIARLRFHGRGGQGVKLASRIVSRAVFLSGVVVQDSPLYGAERRGAPVVAFVRLSGGTPIVERGWVERPDVVVVMDDSLVDAADAGVLDGVDDTTLVVANSRQTAEALRARFAIPGRVVTADASAIALAELGRIVPSAPVAALTVKATGIASWASLAVAIDVELREAGLDANGIARNIVAARKAFEATGCVPLVARSAAAAAVPPAEAAYTVPRVPARVAAPSIRAGGTSALRTTEGWRTSRPVVDLARCTRCFLCFVLCPEGAIHLAADDAPIVDYAHCKGCLVCATECPPHAIAAIPEPPR